MPTTQTIADVRAELERFEAIDAFDRLCFALRDRARTETPSMAKGQATKFGLEMAVDGWLDARNLCAESGNPGIALLNGALQGDADLLTRDDFDTLSDALGRAAPKLSRPVASPNKSVATESSDTEYVDDGMPTVEELDGAVAGAGAGAGAGATKKARKSSESMRDELMQVSVGRRSSPHRDILWVYANLGVPPEQIDQTLIPSPGAVELLYWSRGKRDEFFKSMLPRVLPTQRQIDDLQRIDQPADETLVLLDAVIRAGKGEKLDIAAEQKKVDEIEDERRKAKEAEDAA